MIMYNHNELNQNIRNRALNFLERTFEINETYKKLQYLFNNYISNFLTYTESVEGGYDLNSDFNYDSLSLEIKIGISKRYLSFSIFHKNKYIKTFYVESEHKTKTKSCDAFTPIIVKNELGFVLDISKFKEYTDRYKYEPMVYENYQRISNCIKDFFRQTAIKLK